MQFQAPESLSEQIAQHLGQRIITGVLAPGERVQELKVAGELDVSRGSVREALLILERRYLVEIFPRRGAVVSRLTPSLVNSLYDIYIELLCMLGRKVLEQWSAEDLAGLFAAMDELQRTLKQTAGPSDDDGIRRVVDAGFGLMRYAYGLVDNPFLEETLENFRPAISRTYYVAMEGYQGGTDNTQQFLQELTVAVQQGDADALDAAIRRFGEHQRRQVLAILEQETTA
ncbi:GntR family transcriptional regulator [Marinobacter xestospongiae]|uniref:GntR family transcriptional regulator n=1 Tax=Marinobacter xestospongiae TaxID=994319 RepID=UPI0020043B2F|nr:GntR family transcriptional regulator [Marinobacter xestospongiae]MCK7565731.1 GntR family transcriptional regulator [Marinobacter xestospongiae]